jgi:lysophospholipase L1-like esterase
MVGDSITYFTAHDLVRDLRPHFSARVVGVQGASMAQALPALRSLIDTRSPPRDVVIELGTNDASPRQTTSWHQDFENEMGAVQPARCVIWVTVSPVTYLDGPVGRDLNRAISGAVSGDPGRQHTLNWGTEEYRHSSWVSPDNAIHPTAAGRAELARLVEESLVADCG